MNKTAAETGGSLNSGSITHSKPTRNSTSSNVNQRKIPIYLRVSTGSCHDLCKYGRGHAVEDKPKILPRKRMAKPSLNEDPFIEILVCGEQKKKNVDTKKHPLKPCPNSHSQRPNALSSGKTRSPKPPKIKILLPQDSVDDDKMSRKDHRAFAQHPSSVKSKPLVRAKTPTTVPVVLKSSPSKTTSNKARRSGSVKSSFRGKDQCRMETEASNGEVSEKTLHVIPENVGFSQENPSTGDEVNGTDEFMSENKTSTMEIEKNVLELILDSHVTPPLTSKSSSHRRSSSSSKSKFSSHRRSPSSSSSSSSSSSTKSSCDSRSPSMSFLEDEIKQIVKETNKLCSVKKTTPNNNSKAAVAKGNQRKTRVISCDDKHNRPVKLKFRSGKIMEPRQDTNSNNLLRRLTFRRMRLHGNKAETSVFHKSLEISSIQPYTKFLTKTSRVVVSEYKRRSPMRFFGSGNNMPLRLRFTIIGADEVKSCLKRNNRNGVEDANLVKLKHQDLKGKDGQCLFNNVIEETASKLVESRKSKVKALVGAFETVISLQEHI